jgi:outer membrane protein OmpA-like peptidoglycan-associated protein
MTANFRLGLLVGILSSACVAGPFVPWAIAAAGADERSWRVAQASPKPESEEEQRKKQQEKRQERKEERRDMRQMPPGSGPAQGEPRQLPPQRQDARPPQQIERQPGPGQAPVQVDPRQLPPQRQDARPPQQYQLPPKQPATGPTEPLPRPTFRQDAQPKLQAPGQPVLGSDRPQFEQRARRLDDIKQLRRERVEEGGRRTIIEEPDRRLIVREQGRAFIRHDETDRFRRRFGEARTERLRDGNTTTTFIRPDGVHVISVFDSHGRLVHRYRRHRDGRIIVLIDNRRYIRPGVGGLFLGGYIELPPPIIRIPREKYIVEYDRASYDDIYEALTAPPVDTLERGYSLDEIRQSRYLRERMRRIDIDINFGFGSWEVDPSQYRKLERLADVINRILERNPDEIIMIEGHTDAVGSDEDNLTLSDRRAEAVALILSDHFGVPPENLVTQGYGEQFLKVETPGPEPLNRRVTARRITPLLARRERY